MKRLVSILSIFVALVVACVIEQIITHNYINSIEEQVKTIQSSYTEITPENKDELYQKVSSVVEDWNNKEDILCLFVNHNDIKDLGSELVKSQNAIKEDDTTMFLEGITLSLFYLNGYKQFMFINFRSIF